MPPIYCHYLDRELANLVRYHPSTRRSAYALAASVLLADPFAFASLSGIHESPGIKPIHTHVLPALLEAGLLATVSDQRSADEFLFSRRAIYAYDRRRYPFYFGGERRSASLFVPSITKDASTTSALELRLPSTILENDRDSRAAIADEAQELVLRRLAARDGRAITFALFRPGILGGAATPVGHEIRRSISVAYSRLHMELFADAVILPGIPHLDQLDSALANRGRTVFPRFRWIISLMIWSDRGFWNALGGLDRRAWQDLICFALGPRGQDFRTRLIAWKRLDFSYLPAATNTREQRALGSMQDKLVPSRSWQDNLAFAAEYFSPDLQLEDYMSTTVLIHCVSTNERRGILRACAAASMRPGPPIVGRFAAAEALGELNGLDFILVRSSAGSVGQDAAQGVVTDAVDDFKPRVVVAVGIAFGLKVGVRPTAPVILLASSVKSYERVRIGRHADGSLELRDRGEVGNPDPIRLQKIRTVADSVGCNIAVGQVLCGEKLVDEPNFRAELARRFPDALGGEMEGSGVAAGCARRRSAWLVLKAVSDLGDGNKSSTHEDEDAAQESAAATAMQLVLDAARAGCL